MANNTCDVISTAWTLTPVTQLSNQALLDATARTASEERHVTAKLLSLLAEVDARKIYLGEGCSSLFVYCTRSCTCRSRRLTAGSPPRACHDGFPLFSRVSRQAS